MRFTVEDLADFGRIILQKYPILKEFNPLVDYPYENERISRLTIEIANINDLVRLQNELDEFLVRIMIHHIITKKTFSPCWK